MKNTGVKIQELSRSTGLDQVRGFDNTGSIMHSPLVFIETAACELVKITTKVSFLWPGVNVQTPGDSQMNTNQLQPSKDYRQQLLK